MAKNGRRNASPTTVAYSPAAKNVFNQSNGGTKAPPYKLERTQRAKLKLRTHSVILSRWNTEGEPNEKCEESLREEHNLIRISWEPPCHSRLLIATAWQRSFDGSFSSPKKSYAQDDNMGANIAHRIKARTNQASLRREVACEARRKEWRDKRFLARSRISAKTKCTLTPSVTYGDSSLAEGAYKLVRTQRTKREHQRNENHTNL